MIAQSHFNVTTGVHFINSVGVATGRLNGVPGLALTAVSAVDWYEQQRVGTVNSNIFWKEIAPKVPQTTLFASEKNSRFDEIHVAVIDDAGTVTGTQGTILEKFVGLSKASDATSNETSPDKNYYKTFLADLSEYIYAGANLGDVSAVWYRSVDRLC